MLSTSSGLISVEYQTLTLAGFLRSPLQQTNKKLIQKILTDKEIIPCIQSKHPTIPNNVS